MFSDLAIVEFQALRNSCGEFVIKELCIVSPHNIGQIAHYFFLPPYQESLLSDKARKSNYYCTSKIHGLHWNDGVEEYNLLKAFLIIHTRSSRLVVTKGEEKAIFLTKLLNRPIANLDSIVLQKLESWPGVGGACIHNGSCASQNALKLAQWFERISALYQPRPPV